MLQMLVTVRYREKEKELSKHNARGINCHLGRPVRY